MSARLRARPGETSTEGMKTKALRRVERDASQRHFDRVRAQVVHRPQARSASALELEGCQSDAWGVAPQI